MSPKPSRLIIGGLALLGAAALVFFGSELNWEAWRARLVAPSHSRFPLRGIDVSHHQGPIDWPRVRASGQSFAFIKASEGTDFRDTRFVENWQAARAAGLVTGAYHFFTFCSPGIAQAENFLAVAPPRRPEHELAQSEPLLPLAVDIEFTGNCVGWESVASIQRELRVFVERLESGAGRRPLLYTTLDCLRELIPPELKGHPYWLRSLWGEPKVDAAWQFWQHSALGEVPGVQGPVDLNVFAGSEANWQGLVLSGLPSPARVQGLGSRDASQVEASATDANSAP
jgi:lysozyme